MQKSPVELIILCVHEREMIISTSIQVLLDGFDVSVKDSLVN